MDIIKSVFDTAEKFMENPKHVLIDRSMLQHLASVMEEEGVTKFPNELNLDETKLEGEIRSEFLKDEVRLELLAGSINYCYWYGKADLRPNNASSVLMYDLLRKSYEEGGNVPYWGFEEMVNRYIALLAENRFPLLEERKRHLYEVINNWETFICMVIKDGLIPEEKKLPILFNVLVKTFPGFGADIFLKRASLFFMQLNRKFGWYENDINKLPVPADYQVPKMLEFYGAIKYNEELLRRVMNEELIPKGSLMECEIRAATIIACKTISDRIGWTSQQVDSWLWLRRKKCGRSFHLTITTDY